MTQNILKIDFNLIFLNDSTHKLVEISIVNWVGSEGFMIIIGADKMDVNNKDSLQCLLSPNRSQNLTDDSGAKALTHAQTLVHGRMLQSWLLEPMQWSRSMHVKMATCTRARNTDASTSAIAKY